MRLQISQLRAAHNEADDDWSGKQDVLPSTVGIQRLVTPVVIVIRPANRTFFLAFELVRDVVIPAPSGAGSSETSTTDIFNGLRCHSGRNVKQLVSLEVSKKAVEVSNVILMPSCS